MSRKSNTEEFIKKSESIHGKVYDYSLVDYMGYKTKVSIICSVHGKFEQTPNSHLGGHGCKKCGDYEMSQKRILSRDDFIKRAKLIHGDKYDYSLVNYSRSMNYVDIICKDHGVFSIKGNDHTSGKKGCPECGKYFMGWNYNIWEKRGNSSSKFDSFKLYIIKCYNDNEVFYKIGKTFKKINVRFDGNNKIPYNFDVIKIIEGSAKEVSNFEKDLHKENKSFRYTPKIKFAGMHECFSKILEYGD